MFNYYKGVCVQINYDVITKYHVQKLTILKFNVEANFVNLPWVFFPYAVPLYKLSFGGVNIRQCASS